MKASHQPAPAVRTPRQPRLGRRLLLLALALGGVPAVAQQLPASRSQRPPVLPALTPGDTVRQVVELPPATIDSLAAEPLAEPPVDSVRLAWLQTPPTFSDLVGDRMSCIETAAPHQFNAAVLAYVRLFTERQRGYTQRVLEREQFYFPIFEKYLAKYNLPLELKYLSVVESALIPTAKSPVGAVGLWQFMPPTAGDLRLKRDEWVDERMHPEKATEAACKYLRALYSIFHDWELVLAAYNWGTGNMQRVIRKTGKHNFWELYPHLPAETRNYVPTFTAIMYAMKYAPEHSLNDPKLHYQAYEPLDTLGLQGQALDLRRLSRALGYTDSLALNRYNPELRHGALPAGYRPYVLRYPTAAREHLGDADHATLLAYCQLASDLPQPLAGRLPRLAGVEPWPSRQELVASSSRPAADEAAPRLRRLHYTVRRGQTLTSVAEKFAVSPAQLRRWNELSKNQNPKPGRQLVVLVPQPAVPVPAAAPGALASAAPHHFVVVDSAAQALAAANARYARQAHAAAQREATQVQELLRVQKQQAARIAAQQRLAIFRAAALAKAAAAEEKARQLALAEASRRPESSAPVLLASADTAASPDSSAPALPTRRSHATPASTAFQPYDGLATPIPAARTTSLAAASLPDIYTVQPGDNLSALASTRGVSVANLKAWNQLPSERVLAGQRLRFSAPPEVVAARAQPAQLLAPTHIVQPGDTLFNLARRFKVSVQELRRLNHLTSDDVKLGQKLRVRT